MASPKPAIGDGGLVKKPDTNLVKPITNPAEFRKAIHDAEVVVIFVYARCGFCQRMAPLVENAARSKGFGSVMFYKVDSATGSKELKDVIAEEMHTIGVPSVFVFYLGQIFRLLNGYRRDFSDWLANAVSASQRAMDGAVISHPDLLKGNPPTIKEITSLEDFFQITRGQRLVILYLHSTRSSKHKHYSRIFECWAVVREGQELYCILDGDKYTEIVEEMGIDMVTGVVGFYRDKKLGWSVAGRRTWARNFGEWISELFYALKTADSALVSKGTVPSSDQIMPITEITSWTQLREIVSTHNHVAINIFIDKWPYSRAVSLVFDRAAADGTLNDIYFAKMNVGEQRDIARQLKAYEGTIILFSDGERVMDQPKQPIMFDSLKDQLKHINTADGFIDALGTGAKSSNELKPGEIGRLQLVDTFQTPVVLEATRSEEMNVPGPVSKAGTLKGTESPISLTSSIISSRFTCQGRYQLRPQRPMYKKALNIQPQLFSDYENGCLFTPKSKEQRLQIGLANEVDSRFSIELSCDKHVGGETIICFNINFIVDPTAGARYQSAVFEVNFSQLEDDDGQERPLTIRDFEPKDQQGEATEVQIGRALDTSAGVSGGHSLLSLSTTTSLSTTQQYTKKTASRIMGACVSPSTVNWAFKEDEGPAGRNGLAATHVVHARIPSTGLTSIRFWAKAILVRPRRPRVGLRIGSTESLSEKLLDLHVLHFEKA